ncbi:serine/threonine-protein kinase [Vairimorpha necatrix]|uniref:non-specific serine/threonine protein kinase n=1 Tax=Vairimorpha necatrix TaxID=6039 RepID=A0AAX4JFK1_9MICR
MNNENSSLSFEDSLYDEILSNGEIDDNEYVENEHLAYYKILKLLGTGSSSKVVLTVNTINNEQVAIKIIKRKSSHEFKKSDSRIFREIVMSTLINHPYIVRLKDFLFSKSYYFLIFEYVNGKQLYDLIVDEGFLQEKVARRYFRQIVSAISYIHNNSIVHRDLKIENILLDENDNIKIIDFGLSNFYDNKMLLNTFCGSLYFAAPELLKGNRYCGPEIDIWSLGVILFVLLNGSVPFDDKEVTQLQDKIKAGNFQFTNGISEDSKDLVIKMLQPNPLSRIHLPQVLEHRWINIGYDIPINNYLLKRYPLKDISRGHIEALSSVMNFQFRNLKREILKYYNICVNEEDSLKHDYWIKRPVICMYYMMLEIFEDDRRDESISDFLLEIEEENLTNNISFSDDTKIFLYKLNRFVSYVISKEKLSPCSKFYKKTVFDNFDLIDQNSGSFPIIKNTYIRGFFRGIRIKNIGTKNALKKILIDLFNSNNFKYKIDKKYFICDIEYSSKSCVSFKISMYYNCIVGEYYINISHINGEKSEFDNIYNTVYKSLKEQRVL